MQSFFPFGMDRKYYPDRIHLTTSKCLCVYSFYTYEEENVKGTLTKFNELLGEKQS